MTLIWVRANEFRTVRDPQKKVRVPHLSLMRQEMPRPTLVPSNMLADHVQEYGLRVDPRHSLRWWARHAANLQVIPPTRYPDGAA